MPDSCGLLLFSIIGGRNQSMTDNIQFDFGQNWDEFSKHSLTPEKVQQAVLNFSELVDSIDLENKSFLDIGFGQGLGLLTATALKAKTVGCDINPKCGYVLDQNKKFFPQIEQVKIPVIIGSILDDSVIKKISDQSPDKNGNYAIVHSWGVLHHTGKMWEAINNAANLVSDKGIFIIAIYNRHWSSLMWKFIKWFYNISPRFIKWVIINFFYVVIAIAKFLVTGKNPFKTKRGMNFYYDVIDWVGGYPYEYASKDEIKNFVEKKGYKLIKFNKARVPTGCNEFIFEKL